MQWSWTVSFWNAPLKGAESKSLHNWAVPRGLHVGNQTLFHALPRSSSVAADVQGSSKALPANLHVRTANLLSFCPTHTHTHKNQQKHTQLTHTDRCSKTDIKQGTYFYASLVCIPQCSFLCWGYSISPQLCLSFPSVQQLGKMQHVLTDSGNSFI